MTSGHAIAGCPSREGLGPQKSEPAEREPAESRPASRVQVVTTGHIPTVDQRQRAPPTTKSIETPEPAKRGRRTTGIDPGSPRRSTRHRTRREDLAGRGDPRDQTTGIDPSGADLVAALTVTTRRTRRGVGSNRPQVAKARDLHRYRRARDLHRSREGEPSRPPTPRRSSAPSPRAPARSVSIDADVDPLLGGVLARADRPERRGTARRTRRGSPSPSSRCRRAPSAAGRAPARRRRSAPGRSARRARSRSDHVRRWS